MGGVPVSNRARWIFATAAVSMIGIILLSTIAISLDMVKVDKDSFQSAAAVAGIVSSIASAIGLATVSVSLALQARASNVTARISATERMAALIAMAIHDEELQACWYQRDLPEGGPSRKQRLYSNQVLRAWEMEWNIGTYTTEHVRQHLRDRFMSNAIARTHWQLARSHRLLCGCGEMPFHQLSDSEYKHVIQALAEQDEPQSPTVEVELSPK
jgi:hypothetical protein